MTSRPLQFRKLLHLTGTEMQRRLSARERVMRIPIQLVLLRAL